MNEHVNTSLKPSTKTTRLPPDRTAQRASLEAPRPRAGPQHPQAARPPLLSSLASRAARAGEPPAHEGCRAARGRPAAAFRLRRGSCTRGCGHQFCCGPGLTWTLPLAPGPSMPPAPAVCHQGPHALCMSHPQRPMHRPHAHHGPPLSASGTDCFWPEVGHLDSPLAQAPCWETLRFIWKGLF